MFKLYHWLTNFDEMILLLIFYMVRESIEFQPPKKKKKKKKNPPNTKQRGHAWSVQACLTQTRTRGVRGC